MIPEMRVVSTISAEEWEHEEKRIIFEARLTHPKLLNVADGGNMPKCSVETRRENAKNLNAGIYDQVKSHPDLIRYTYNRLIRLFANRGDIDGAKLMVIRMKTRALMIRRSSEHGQTSHLHAMARPSKFTDAMPEQARFLAEKGCTDAEIAAFFKVTEQTVNNWKIAHPEFLSP